MKNTDSHFDLKSLPQQLGGLGGKLTRYVPIVFFLLVAVVYGFVMLRITMLANTRPSDSTQTSQITALTPHIDKQAVSQLQKLEDNSVNVKSLFEDARNNPFNE